MTQAETRTRPQVKPTNPCFSSGPCAKRPGWTPAVLAAAPLGRSHRAAAGQGQAEGGDRAFAGAGRHAGRLAPARRLSRPRTPGRWSWRFGTFLGARGVDVLAWDSFGRDWAGDIRDQLRLDDVRYFEAAYGQLPDLGAVDPARDLVFTWNGTTSGVCLPDADWIAADRQGLAICDATSAIFAMPLAWERLDVVTWSWQKVLGGEAAHGMLALGPRALERLRGYDPPWPLPKIFRIKKKGVIDEAIFAGSTLNTPSMLAVEDALDGLAWAEQVGGLGGLMARCRSNAQIIDRWAAASDWIAHLVEDSACRSTSSVCLKPTDPLLLALGPEAQRAFFKRLAALLEEEGVAYDIGAYRAAPPGLRLWAGATVERENLEALLPWLDWAYDRCREALAREGA